MKAFLIDPFNRTITEVEHNGDFHQIYEFLQITTPFTVVALGEEYGRDSIFLDDEGLYAKDQRYFLLAGYPQPLAGRGLVLGCDDEGETVAPQKVTLDELHGLIAWTKPELRFSHITTEESEIDHPVFGRTAYIANTPHFTLEPEETNDGEA